MIDERERGKKGRNWLGDDGWREGERDGWREGRRMELDIIPN